MHIRDSSGIFGAERVILTLAKNIDPGKVKIGLLCLRRKDGRSQALMDAAGQAGVPVFPVDVSGRFDLGALWTMRSILRSQKVDVIHTHDFKSDFYGLLATAATAVARVATAHGSTRDSWLKKLYLFFTEKGTYRFFHRIIAVSQDLHGYLRACGVPPWKIETIQNGIDFSLLAATAAAAEAPLPDLKGRCVFSVVGRLFPDKGHRFFLEAFSRVRRRYPQAAAMIIGDGPEKENILAQVRQFELEETVHLCGVRADMAEVYGRTDCLVIPSLTEGLPYVLLEAMGKQVPVIASAVGDIPLLLKPGLTGRLVTPGDVDDLEQKMISFLAHPSKTDPMVVNACNLVTEKYSASQMAAKTEALYRQLTKTKWSLT